MSKPVGGLPLRPYVRLMVADRGDAWRLAFVLFLLFGSAVADAFGVGAVLPFIALLQDPELGRGTWIRDVLDARGIDTHAELIFVGGVALAVAFVLKNTYLAVAQAAQIRFIFRRVAIAERTLLEAYLAAPYSFHLRKNSAELVRNLIADTTTVFNAPMQSAFNLTVESLTVIVLAIVLTILEPVGVPLAAIVVGGVGFVVQRVLLRRNHALGVRARDAQLAKMKWSSQALAAIKELRIAGRENYFIAQFETEARAHALALQRSRIAGGTPRFVLEALGVVGLVTVSVVITMRGGNTADAVPVLGVLAVAVVRLMPAAIRILSALADVRFYAPAAEAIADELATATADEIRRTTQRTREVLHLRERLEIDDVTFAYDGADRNALDGVSLTLTRGESLALVGESGSGKTTLADLVIGLIRPARGTLRVDGRDLSDDDVPRWQNGLSYVPQHVYLIDDTLRANIAFGVPKPEIDDARLQHAIDAAQLRDLVKSLPEGLDAGVGERGVRLSGGQRQRIGIARALYNAPDVLVLDEATSALDGVTEREVVRAIDGLKGSVTLIVIAHRLSTVRKCDRLAMLDHGRLVQIGTFAELERGNAAFQRMVAAGDHRPEGDAETTSPETST